MGILYISLKWGNRVTENESPNNNALEEWKETRSKISKIDDNLHDLRKYGLTFVAGLLAVNSIQAYINLGGFTKFFIGVITIAFITVLNLLDVYNQRISYAASIRATVLETAILNFELNEVISHRFKMDNLLDCIKAVYIGFIMITVAIGVTVIFVNPSTPTNTPTNLSTSPTTSLNLNIPGILIVILEFLFLLLLVSAPFIIIKLNIIHKIYKFIVESIKLEPLYQVIKITLTAFYCIITLLSFYTILRSLFSLELTLSILLLILGCAGIYIIIEFWNKLFIKTNINRKKSNNSKRKPKKKYYFKGYDDWLKLKENIPYAGTLYDFVIDSKNKRYVKRLDDWMKSIGNKPYTGVLDYWTVDRICCEQGEVVKITLTNFGKEDITINWGEEVCEIRSEDGNYCEILYAERNITVPPECNHSWLWNTSKATKDGKFPTEGIYRVKPIKPCTWDNLLKRSVFIHCSCKIKT